MITNICPACGYPTLDAALCAFCCPAEAFAVNQGWGPAPSTTPHREPAWLDIQDSDSHSGARVRNWTGPIAS